MADVKYVAKTDLKARDGTSPKLKRIARTARVARQAIKRLSGATLRLAVNAGKLTALTAGLSPVLGHLANKRTREMSRLADSVGQNVETMEALGVVAKQIGLDYDNVIDLAEEMNNKLGEFAGLEKMESAREALQMMGLEFENVKDLEPEKQFEKIVDALLKMPDQQKSSSAADMLFGSEASKFFGLMHRLGLSLDQIKRQYKDNSLLTKEGREGAIKWAQAMGRLGNQARTFGAQLAGVLGGALAPFVTKISDWVQANRELIQTKINEWGDKLVSWISQIDMDQAVLHAQNFEKAFTNVPWASIANSILLVATNIDKIVVATGALIAIWGGSKVLKAAKSFASAAAIAAAAAGVGPSGGGKPTSPGKPARGGALRGIANRLNIGKGGVYGSAALAAIYAGSFLSNLSQTDENKQKLIQQNAERELEAIRRARELIKSGDILMQPDGTYRNAPGNLTRYDPLLYQSAKNIPREQTGGDAGVAEALFSQISAAIAQSVPAALSQALGGAVDINVRVKVDGPGQVQNVGTSSSSGLVGNVGTNKPGYEPGP